MDFVIISLGVLALWEFISDTIPLTIPAWLQYPIVLLLGGAIYEIPSSGPWRYALGAAGLVLLLHTWIRGRNAPDVSVAPRQGRVPRLPR